MGNPESPAAGQTTERRFLRSTLAAYTSQFGRTLIRLVAELALARMVLPADHGLFDRALAIVVLVGACRDLGLVYQVVRDERQPFGTVLAWVLGTGGLLTVALSLSAPLFGSFDSALPDILRIFALYVLLDALAVVPRVYFERQLAVGFLVAPELLRGFVFASVSIALAAQGLGVWSFVVGELTAAALFAVLLWIRAWRRIPLRPHLHLIPELLRKSILLFLIWVAALSIPFVGRFVLDDNFMVGQYNKAYLWALRLQILVLPALVRVLYPALVEYRQDRDRFITLYRMGTLSILALETLAAYFLFFNAEVVLIDILLGDAWHPAVPLLRILCFVPLVDPFTRLGGEVLKVHHQDRTWLLIVVLNLLCLIAFGILFTQHWGARGMAWANYLLLGNLIMTWRIYRICRPQFVRLVRELLLVYATPLPLFVATALLFPAGSWSRFASSVLAAVIAGAVLLWLFYRPFRAFFATHVPEENSSLP